MIPFLFILLFLLTIGACIRGWAGFPMLAWVVALFTLFVMAPNPDAGTPITDTEIGIVIAIIGTIVVPMFWFGERGRKRLIRFFEEDVSAAVKKLQEWNQ